MSLGRLFDTYQPGLMGRTVAKLENCGEKCVELVEYWDLTVPGCPICVPFNETVTTLTRTRQFTQQEWTELCL